MATLTNLYDSIKIVLKGDKENRFFAENGELLRNKLFDAVLSLDNQLIKLLLSNEITKNKFFKEIDGILIFDKDSFGLTINNKEFLPDSFTCFKNKIGLVDNKKQFISNKGDVVLSFPYKDCILEGGQTKEDQKRGETFYNETLALDEVDRLLAPKVFTNIIKCTKDGEEKINQFKDNDNLLIKGNNLLALSSLLKRYEGKIKCIYIDPPYNTGSDSFNYNDSFNHSSWLTFMYNRLKFAKKLLKDDGAIFVSINHIELAYITIIMDEIFGRENKLPLITLKAGTTASYRSINTCPVNVTEYVLAYQNTPKFKTAQIYKQSGYSEDYSHYIMNKSSDPSDWELKSIADIIHEKNGCKTWQEYRKKLGSNWKKIRLEQMETFAFENKDKIVSLNTLQKPSKKIQDIINLSKSNRNKVFSVERDGGSNIYCYNGRTLAFYSSKFKQIGDEYVPAEILTNLWTDISFLGIGPEGGVTLENGKKPEFLIKTILELSTTKNDIILDYHLGCGTTSAVAHKMGRQWIGIEQLNYGENDSLVRLKNVLNGDQSGISKDTNINWNGGGSFIYCEIKENNQRFINKILQSNTDKDLYNLLQQIITTGFISYKADLKKINENEKEFEQLSMEDKKNFLIELLDKNMLYVNYSDINDEDFAVLEDEKAFSKSFYEVK